MDQLPPDVLARRGQLPLKPAPVVLTGARASSARSSSTRTSRRCTR
ncbi:MAG: hypothetical protein M3680_09490 [Myxococcota bacterium]|nr:hypothetical protein [Myxococcota bacterium]